MRTNLWTTVLVGGALAILVPALIVSAGFWFAFGLAALWIITVGGGKLGFEILKERQRGVGAAKKRSRTGRQRGRVWERDRE